MTTPEGRVKKKIKSVLAKHETSVYVRMHVPSGYGKQTLDFEGACAGFAFAIEAKAPGKPLSERQDQTIEDMLVGGVRIFFIDGDEGCSILDRWLSAVSKPRSKP